MASSTRPLASRALRRAVAVLSTALVLALAIGPAAQAASPSLAQSVRPVCGTPAAGHARCFAMMRTDIAPSLKPFPAARAVAPSAVLTGPWYPADLQAAYGLTAAASSSGAGRTVAIIDAFDDPTAESDLAVYRANAGLPPCTTANGCFTKVDQNGGTSYPPADAGWSQEISLDLDMVSAICPNCSILLVEANSTDINDLGAAVNRAVTMGAKYISNSYGTAGEISFETTWDTQYYKHAGVVVTASTGDSGYAGGVSYPASSQYVVAVGGTRLVKNGTVWSETAWSGAGSGCSAYEAKPAWQTDGGCAKRALADVSAAADPNAGVAVYMTSSGVGHWYQMGGTSASAPIIAAVYALAGTPAAGTYPASYLYAHGGLTDITSGSTGSCSPSYLCNAAVGFDGPTGLGTPMGTTSFSSLQVPGKPTGVSGVSGASGSGTVTVSWTAPVSDGGSAITGYTATSSPGGKTCAWTSGPLSCAVSGLTTGQTYTFSVTATNGVGTGSASDPSAGVIPVGPPGAPTGVTGTRGNGQVAVSWSAPALTGGAAITGYTVTSSPDAKTCATGGTIGCTVTGLANGTGYTFTVTATNTYGTGAASSASASLTPATVPGAPTGATATPGNASALVTWTAPVSNGGSAITGYTVTSSPDGKTCSGSVPASGCTVSGLANGTPYTFSVTATNGVGTGAASSASSPVTPRTVPGSPANVTGVAGVSSVQVSWTAPASNGGAAVTGYTASASPGGATCTVAAPALTCLVTGLSNGFGYTFTVVASNAAGPGLASAASATITPRTVPDAPTDVIGTPGDGSVAVAWSAPAFDGGSPITGYTVTANPGGQTCSWSSGLLECTITGLDNNQAYTFTVTAANVAGTGSPSAVSSPVTPLSLPGKPTSVVAAVNASDRTALDVTWSAPASDGGSAITGYTATAYEMAPLNAGHLIADKSCVPSPAPATGCTITGLTPGTTIVVRVTATTAVGTGLPSDPSASVLVPLDPPAASMTALATWSVASSLQLAWTPAAGSYPIDHYVVAYRRQAWNSTSWSSAELPTLTGTATAFQLAAGATYCFKVQAIDDHANSGPWSAEKCTTTPLDDRSLSHRGSWTLGTGSSYYRATWSRSTALGSSLVRTSVAGTRLVLVAWTCSTCGSVKVYLGSTYLRTISLKSTTAVAKKVFTIWTTYHAGTVTLKLSTSGSRVLIDGLGVSKQ